MIPSLRFGLIKVDTAARQMEVSKGERVLTLTQPGADSLRIDYSNNQNLIQAEDAFIESPNDIRSIQALMSRLIEHLDSIYNGPQQALVLTAKQILSVVKQERNPGHLVSELIRIDPIPLLANERAEARGAA